MTFPQSLTEHVIKLAVSGTNGGKNICIHAENISDRNSCSNSFIKLIGLERLKALREFLYFQNFLAKFALVGIYPSTLPINIPRFLLFMQRHLHKCIIFNI